MKDDDFSTWSIESLRGYVLMRGEFLQNCMYEDPLREKYVSKLDAAKRELATREAQLGDSSPSYRHDTAKSPSSGSAPNS